jgi:hypothetical protein
MYDVHVIVGNGDVSLSDQFEAAASGNIRPLIIMARNVRPADILRGARVGGFTIWALEFSYYRMASDGYLIWSMRLSLLIPVALLFLCAFLFRRGLQARNRLQTAPAKRGT